MDKGFRAEWNAIVCWTNYPPGSIGYEAGNLLIQWSRLYFELAGTIKGHNAKAH